MKIIIINLICCVFMGFAGFSQQIEWMSVNEALEAQKKQPRKIFMDAYTTWCGPCKMLDRNTFSDQKVIDYINAHYYPVKFNAEGDEAVVYKGQDFTNPGFDPERKGRNSTHQLAMALKITGYPSLVFFDEEGNLITPLTGYRTPAQLELFLKMFASDDYKKITSQEAFSEYEKNFEGTF